MIQRTSPNKFAFGNSASNSRAKSIPESIRESLYLDHKASPGDLFTALNTLKRNDKRGFLPVHHVSYRSTRADECDFNLTKSFMESCREGELQRALGLSNSASTKKILLELEKYVVNKELIKSTAVERIHKIFSLEADKEFDNLAFTVNGLLVDLNRLGLVTQQNVLSSFGSLIYNHPSQIVTLLDYEHILKDELGLPQDSTHLDTLERLEIITNQNLDIIDRGFPRYLIKTARDGGIESFLDPNKMNPTLKPRNTSFVPISIFNQVS